MAHGPEATLMSHVAFLYIHGSFVFVTVSFCLARLGLFAYLTAYRPVTFVFVAENAFF